jgi:hypothetical protein
MAALCLAIGAVLVRPEVAMASHDPTGTPFDEDFVTSTGFETIDAHSGPSGENPVGTIEAIGFTGTISCLNVNGNRASLGVNFPFGQFLLLVEDNGPGTNDRRGFGDPVLPDNNVCPDPDTLSDRLSPPGVEQDYIVHDAPALPSVKDQCKNGGWRNFPDFKSQGQCVAFVQRGPKG